MARKETVCDYSGQSILIPWDTNGFENCPSCGRLLKLRNIRDFTVYSDGDYGEFIRTDNYGTLPRHLYRPNPLAHLHGAIEDMLFLERVTKGNKK